MKNTAKRIKGILALLLLMVLSANSHFLMSVATDDNLQQPEIKVQTIVETEIEKFVGYNLGENKGTLLQFGIQTGIEYENEDERIPLGATGVLLNTPKLDGKYPQSAELVTKSTKCTNGDSNGKDYKISYDSEKGQVKIVTFNKADEEGPIYIQSKEDRDKYSIVLNYEGVTNQIKTEDTNKNEQTKEQTNTEEQLVLSGKVVELLTDEAKTQITKEFEHKIEDRVQKSELISGQINTTNVYNGYIKYNSQKQTDYETTYKELLNLNISKLVGEDETKINVNTILKRNEEEKSAQDVVYTNLVLDKNEIQERLGENGEIKILDEAGNELTLINKDTQVQENGKIQVKFEKEVSNIKIVLSKIEKIGNLRIQFGKTIKSTMNDTSANKIQTTYELASVTKTEQKYKENDEEKTRIVENTIYSNILKSIIEIQDAKTTVEFNPSVVNWTNEKQNEVNLEIELKNNSSQYNLFKNPEFTLELPEEVEKVILDKEIPMHANGLEVASFDYSKDTRVLTLKMQGEQTSYLPENLTSGTKITIPAIIILKSDIENKELNLELKYKNTNTLTNVLEEGTTTAKITLENFTQELTSNTNLKSLAKPLSVANTNANTNQNTNAQEDSAAEQQARATNEELIEGIKLNVKPIRGDVELANGDTVYEGEFIKYEITATNTTNKDLNNVKIQAILPDGVTYGELVREDHLPEVESYYDFTKQLQAIDLGTIKAGKTATTYFEVQVNDLADTENEKNIVTNIKAYIGNSVSANYSITHKVQQAEYKVFLSEKVFLTNEFKYVLKIEGNENVDVKVNLPACMKATQITSRNSSNDYNEQINNLSELNFNLKPGEYLIYASVNTNEIEKNKNCQTEVKAVATVNNKYKSNENRLLLEYYQLLITMSSENEGEEVKYGDEINYVIKVSNNGRVNFIRDDKYYVYANIKDFLPLGVEPIKVIHNNFEINEEYDSGNPDSQYFIEKEDIKESISTQIFGEGGQKASVDINVLIPSNETITLLVKTKAGRLNEAKDIKNFATVSEKTITNDANASVEAKQSNIVTHTILPFNYNEPKPVDPVEPDTPSNQDDPEGPTNPENPTNPEDPENPINPDAPENQETENKYSLSGLVWIDKNEDGIKQQNEKALDNVKVYLAKTNGKISKTTLSSNNGEYKFEDVAKEDYIVVFQYDNNKYRITKYNANGNSKATAQEVTVNGEKITAGVTDIIKLDADAKNINIGLVENKKFDFKVENYISKVTVKTADNTTEKTYDNVALAKTEIKAKEIEGATVEVEYKIVITNNGELAGTVNKVVDYLPQGFSINSENTIWVKNSDGSLINTTIAKQQIEAGKSVEIVLKATKKLTENSLGIFTNKVEIDSVENNLGINEINLDNNTSKCEIILSVSTGVFVNIIIAIVIISITLILLNIKFNIFKKVKIRVFASLILVGVTIFMQANMTSSKALSQTEEYIQNHYLQKRMYLTADSMGPYSGLIWYGKEYKMKYRWVDKYADEKHVCYVKNVDDINNSAKIVACPSWYIKITNPIERIVRFYERDNEEEEHVDIKWGADYNESWAKILATAGRQMSSFTDVYYFDRDWRIFYDTETYPLIKNSDGTYSMSTENYIPAPGRAAGVCLDNEADGGYEYINIDNINQEQGGWLTQIGYYSKNVNAFKDILYTWGSYNPSTNNWNYDFDVLYNFKDNETNVDYHLEGNTDTVVGIKATENDYVLGPLKITDNTIYYSDREAETNNEYTFSITPIDGTTIWSDDIIVCEDENGSIEYNKTPIRYHVNDGGTENITRITKNSNFYLKVNKSLIDTHGGVGYITGYSKKDYISYRDVDISGVGVWHHPGKQDVASPVNINYSEPSDKTAVQEINWNFSKSGICVRKIDQFDGASDNITNNRLGEIEFKIFDNDEHKFLLCDSLGNFSGYSSGGGTILRTDNNGIAYVDGTSVQYIVGINPDHEYRVYETYIPEGLQDYYKNETKPLNVIWEDGEYGSITITEGFFIEYIAKNYRDYTSLQLHKQDEQGHNLTGITFRILDITNDSISDRREKYVYFYKGTYNYAGYNQFNDSYNIANGLIAPETLGTGFSSSSIYTAEIVTGDDGLTPLLRKLPLGRKYRIEETNLGIYDNIYGTKIVKEITTEAQADGIMLNWDSEKIINKQEYGSLTLAKREKATQAPLQGFGFKIWCMNKSSYSDYGWLKIDETTHKPISYNNDYNDGTTVYTTEYDSSRKVYKIPDIIKLDMDYVYYIYEVFIPDEYRDYFTLDSISGGTDRVFDVRIVSNSLNTRENSNMEKYCVVEGINLNKGVKNQYPYNESVVTYATNLSDAELSAIEKQIGRKLREEDKYIANKQTYISISGKVWEEAITGKNTLTTNNVYNDKTDYPLNNIQVSLIDKDGNIVKIKDQNGNEMLQQTTTTNLTKAQLKSDNAQNGAYVFDYVVIDNLNDYRVRFTYDGYTYENVIPFAGSSATEKLPQANTSKASEDYYEMKRSTFNKYWNAISGSESQRIYNGTTGVELDYQNEFGGGLKKGVTIGNTTGIINNPSGNFKAIINNGKFLITADTFGEGYRGVPFSRLKYYYDNISKYYLQTRSLFKVIPYINLGLCKREMPNLALQKDTYKSDVKVNGKSYTYMYDFKLRTLNEEDGSGVKVDFDNDYCLPIYEADANYAEVDPNNGLEATITYKIALQNLSNNLYTEIKSLDEYFTKATITKDGVPVSIGLEIDKDGSDYAIYLSDSRVETKFNDDNRLNVSVEDNPSMTDTPGLVGKKIKFNDPIRLSKMIHDETETNTKYLYIRFKIINVKECFYLLTNEEEWNYYTYNIADKISLFENYAEIGTYSVYSSNAYNEASRYAAVDYTSRPTNFNPLDFERTDEDDSDKAPGLKIVSVKPRSIDGIVFEDTPVYKFTARDSTSREIVTPVGKEEIEKGEERLGNGYYDKTEDANNLKKEADKPVEGVKVELVNPLSGEKVKIWDAKNKIWTDELEIKTGEDGKYHIEGFVPGDYKINFVWGEEFGNKDVREYKSTVYTNGKYNATVNGITTGYSKMWIYDSQPYNNALDDYNRRLAIDQNALGIDIDAKKEDGKTDLYSDKEKEEMGKFSTEDLKTMVSSTAKFVIGVEKGATDNDKSNSEALGNAETYLDNYLPFEIVDIDFGLIERPRQSMGVKKHLKSISIRTADGRPVIIANIDVDGKVNAIAGESYISGGFNLEYIYAQIDKNLQGDMEVKLEYEITVDNSSEKDYDGWQYYYLGTPTENEIKLKNDYLYDYLSGASINSEDEKWQTADMTENYLITPSSTANMPTTVVEEEFLRMKEEFGKNDKTLNEKNIAQYIESEFKFDNYGSSKEHYNQLFVKWATEITDPTGINAINIRKYKLADKIVLKGTGENSLTNLPYEAGETRTERMKVSKLLANGDDIQFNNEVEIATVSVNKDVRTARRVNTKDAPLYDVGEYLTITPATGENRDYFGLIIAIIGILTVFASGIILLKRFMKK